MSGPLAGEQKCRERIRATWPDFSARRAQRLAHGTVVERVAENILEDLFTTVLDWPIGEVKFQEDYSDIVLTRLGIKYLVLEAKRPGSLAWSRRAVEAALSQALGYATEQKVRSIAVSDGVMLYAADIRHGGLSDRVFASLATEQPDESLWWLSLHGIYRDRSAANDATLRLLPDEPVAVPGAPPEGESGLLHRKYQRPARCFAFVGDATKTSTWSLPYLEADGTVDTKRLPKAIGSIISNYRGGKVSKIPEAAIPDVLERLGRAAVQLGKMPFQGHETADVYAQLEATLEQLGRLEGLRDASSTESDSSGASAGPAPSATGTEAASR